MDDNGKTELFLVKKKNPLDILCEEGSKGFIFFAKNSLVFPLSSMARPSLF